MKKLFLMIAAAATFAVFATPAQAQQYQIDFPIGAFNFIQPPPTTVQLGQEFTVTFSISANAADPYPGKTAEDIFNYSLSYLRQALRAEGEIVISHRENLRDYGWFKLKITGKAASGSWLIKYPNGYTTLVR